MKYFINYSIIIFYEEMYNLESKLYGKKKLNFLIIAIIQINLGIMLLSISFS